MHRERPKKEFEEVLLEVRRVTRVTTWWRRMSFRATILIGNKKGKIGVGSAKGADVGIAVKKASHEAYKNIFLVPVATGNTVPYPVTKKFKSAIIKLLPASMGTGLKAGSSVRAVLELAWYENMLSKIIGSNNKLNNALATIYALSAYKHAEHFSATNKSSDTKNEDTTDTKETPKEGKKTPTKAVEKTKTPTAEKKKAPAKKAAAKKPAAKKTAEKPQTPATEEKKAPAKKAAAKKPAAKKTPKKDTK